MYPAAMDVQRRRYIQALTQIAEAQDDRDSLTGYLEELGRAHRKFGVRERHYEVFRRALMATLHRFAAHAWDEAAQHAWETAFDHAATIMIEAARRDAAESAAWWIATVTGMELRGPDIAVLTLQPEQPLSYLPGQHVSVQTPHWPRLWRTYSIANAPHPDGLLRLHVRAVTGGPGRPIPVQPGHAREPLLLGSPARPPTPDMPSRTQCRCLAGRP